jgi:hypothetical protein
MALFFLYICSKEFKIQTIIPLNMNKLILSIAACLTLGFTASAQNYAIYEGASSTTDISGTTVQVQVGSSIYEGFFFGKNLTGTPIEIKIRRVSLIAPPAAVTEQVCTGPIPDPTAIGNCFDIAAGNANWLSPNNYIIDDANKANIEVHIDPHGSLGMVHNRYYMEDLNGNKLDSVDLKIGNFASIKEVKPSVTFNAYPNPADDILTLSVQGSTENTVKLVDVLGNVVMEDKMSTTKKIDVREFKNGVYILTVYANGALLQTRRVVVRH